MRPAVIGIVVFFGMACGAQSYPEVDALLELAFATDSAVVVKHLPLDLVEAVEHLPVKEQREFERGLMLTEKMKRDRIVIDRSDLPSALAEIHQEGEPPKDIGTLFLDKRISDGYESLLCLRFQPPSTSQYSRNEGLFVWMRLEEGEWRLVRIQPAQGPDRVNFEGVSMLEKFRANQLSADEAAAVGSVRTYNTALATYSAVYPEIGFASGLEDLGGTDPENSDANHAALVDHALSTEPFEKSGYRFTYRPELQSGATSAYVLVARPIAHIQSCKRSFLTDESGVIHWTDENRDPTTDDPVIP